MPEIKDKDPYAPPPMHHDRSGAVVRVAILGALLGAGALGYVWMSNQPQTALVPEVVQEQQMADAGYTASENTLPEAVSESQPAAPVATTPAPQRRAPTPRSTPEPQPEPEPTPPPAAVQPVPVTPTPLPPTDIPPPVGTVG